MQSSCYEFTLRVQLSFSGGRVATQDRRQVQAGNTHQVRSLALGTTQDGKRVLESKPIPFPDWVSVETAYGRTFRSIAQVNSKGLLLTWEARAFYSGGARPPPE